MGVVEMPAHPIVGVARMGHRLVTAAGRVRVLRIVLATRVLRRACRRIRSILLEEALDDVLALHVVQVAVMHVVGVALVPDGPMATACTVLVRMPLMCCLIGHGSSLPPMSGRCHFPSPAPLPRQGDLSATLTNLGAHSLTSHRPATGPDAAQHLAHDHFQRREWLPALSVVRIRSCPFHNCRHTYISTQVRVAEHRYERRASK